MRILLTGSSGWLGRHLAPMLRNRGHVVTGLDMAPGPDTQIVGSVADRTVIYRAFAGRGVEAVIHAGGLHKPDIARYDAQAFIDANVTGTLNLLEAARSAGHDRFVFTSTTSLMISEQVREARGDAAAWVDEAFAPIVPRNIYGVTKLAAEQLCRLYHAKHGLNVVVLRTSRFFPEEDDTHRTLSGENMKANEFLHRRLTVRDAAAAHLAALDGATKVGFGTYIVSAPTPFDKRDARALIHGASAVVARRYPQAAALYARRGWRLPDRIDRVYDASLIERELGFRCQTDFAAILSALENDAPLPFEHDARYVSPKERQMV